MAKTMPVIHCSGCEQNFYNGNNPMGVQRCWNLDTAKRIKRRRVGINDVPPWTRKPELLPSCYQQRGYIFVGPTVTR